MDFNITRSLTTLLIVGALTLLVTATSFADTWTQGKGWSRDGNKYKNTYIYKSR